MCVMYIQSTKQNNISFKQSSVFNTIANIESNILLNKGITDIGGFVIPQALMANNKDESIERVFKSVLYFMFTFVSPFLMLPLVNKFALKSNKILSSFGCEQKKILEVSKKYLTGDADRLVDGIKTTSKNLFGDENKFDKLINAIDIHSNVPDLLDYLSNLLGIPVTTLTVSTFALCNSYKALRWLDLHILKTAMENGTDSAISITRTVNSGVVTDLFFGWGGTYVDASPYEDWDSTWYPGDYSIFIGASESD